jgi:hypothetical protein
LFAQNSDGLHRYLPKDNAGIVLLVKPTPIVSVDAYREEWNKK